jgi:hypothetical protein
MLPSVPARGTITLPVVGEVHAALCLLFPNAVRRQLGLDEVRLRGLFDQHAPE